MQQRQFGKSGPKVGAIGLGAMSIAGFFGATDKATSFKLLDKCIDLGVNHIDTALIYGPYISEEWIGEYLGGKNDKFVIATKGGVNPNPRGFNSSPAFLSDCLESSLKRLGIDYIDLYYIHRKDPNIPIEDVMGTLLKFVDEGKIGGIGFSELSPASLERASSVGPVMAMQSEYSLWTRGPELGMLDACKTFGTTFVPFSPVARGVLTDKGVEPEKFQEKDFRRQVPRFNEPQFSYNMAKVEKFKTYANDNGHTTQALALAWVLHQGDHLIPIPGTRTAEHLEEDVKGASISLSETQLAEIEAILPCGFADGYRYSMAQINGTELYC